MMPACPHWNSAASLFFLACAVLGGGAAQAQWSTYPGERPAPATPAAPSWPPQNGMVNQPFGNAPNLPQSQEVPPEQPAADSVAGQVPGPPLPQPDPTPEPRQPDPRSYISVKLQGLDKVTARRQQFEAQIGTVTSFGNLEIVPRACWQSPADERPESAALLEIWQWKPGEKPSFVFFGWMFSSSPALSSLEHPIYDIAVLQCLEEEKKDEKKKEEPNPDG